MATVKASSSRGLVGGLVWAMPYLLALFGCAFMTGWGTFYGCQNEAVYGGMCAGVVLGAWISWQTGWPDRGFSPESSTGDRVGNAMLGAVLAAAIAFVLACVPLLMDRASLKRFNAEAEAFQRDPNGFAFIQRFAAVNFHLPVVYLSGNQAWATTSKSDPSASGASMKVGAGFCALTYRRSTVLLPDAPHGPLEDAWLRGVLVHEFGHCVDESRDLWGSAGRVGTASVAPPDRRAVVDVVGFVAAGSEKKTQLWREAFADLFAVGYWFLTQSGQDYADLTQSLIDKRKIGQKRDDDNSHATECWIEAARSRIAGGQDKPKGFVDLVRWADSVRAGAQCRL